MAESIFNETTREEFYKHLDAYPSSHRLKPQDLSQVSAWLDEYPARAFSRQEFSRQNYVQRIFIKNDDGLVYAKETEKFGQRLVITTDKIIEYVEYAHKQLSHVGSDQTWEFLRANYYGILRQDVTFLHPRCNCPDKRIKTMKRKKVITGPIHESTMSLNSTMDGTVSLSELGKMFEPLKRYNRRNLADEDMELGGDVEPESDMELWFALQLVNGLMVIQLLCITIFKFFINILISSMVE